MGISVKLNENVSETFDSHEIVTDIKKIFIDEVNGLFQPIAETKEIVVAV